MKKYTDLELRQQQSDCFKLGIRIYLVPTNQKGQFFIVVERPNFAPKKATNPNPPNPNIPLHFTKPQTLPHIQHLYRLFTTISPQSP